MKHLKTVPMAWSYDCVPDESDRRSNPGVDIKSLSKWGIPEKDIENWTAAHVIKKFPIFYKTP